MSKCGREKGRIDALEVMEFADALGMPPLGLLDEYLAQRATPAEVQKEQCEGPLTTMDGAAYPNRTDDLLFTRQLLYQLS